MRPGQGPPPRAGMMSVNVNQISEMLKDTELMLSLAKELHAGKKQTD